MGVTDAHGDRVHGAGSGADRADSAGSGADRAHGTRPGSVDAPAAVDALTVAVEGRCSGCGSPLATDQRYCLECGQRRGTAPAPSLGASPAPPLRAALSSPAAGAAPTRSRGPSSVAVIAGIATLVLAMGVGVEIGRLANHGQAIVAASGRPEVIDLAGSGAASGPTASNAAGGSSGSQSASGPSATHRQARSHRRRGASHGGPTAASAPKPTAKAVQRAQSAASSVLGGGAGQSNATVSAGQSCAQGTAGCQNGHFTGNYFGP